MNDVGWLFYVSVALILGIVGQALLVRSELLGNVVFAFLGSGGFMGLWLMAVLAEYYDSTMFIVGILLYLFLCELYLFCVTFVYSSVSANLLLKLRQAAMSVDEIAQFYDNAQMASMRVERLCQVGWAVERDGTLWATPNGTKIAIIFQHIRNFFYHTE